MANNVDLVSEKVKLFFLSECSPLQNTPISLMLASVAVATAKKRFPELQQGDLMLAALRGWDRATGSNLCDSDLRELSEAQSLPKTPCKPKLDATKQQNCTQMSLGFD